MVERCQRNSLSLSLLSCESQSWMFVKENPDRKKKKIKKIKDFFFQVKVLKIFKTSSDCHGKPCRSFKRRDILKIPGTAFLKTYIFFFRELQLITVLLLIRDSYTNWSTIFVSKSICRISSRKVYIFVQLKHHNSFQN